MRSRFRSTQGYQEFDKLVRCVEQGRTVAAASFNGYGRSSVARRLVQRVVEVMSNAYVGVAARRHDAGHTTPLYQEAIVECRGLRLATASGRVAPGFGLFARSLAEFVLHWLHVLSVYFVFAFRRGPSRGPATLLFGVGVADLRRGGNDARFIKYCRRGPIVPLMQATRIIAQAIGKISGTDRGFVEYARFPVHTLAADNLPGFAGFRRFLREHLSILGHYVRSVWRCPAMALLGRDIAYHAMVSDLNARGLIQAIVITNSNYAVQPLWMTDMPTRTYETHLVWYSTNSLPIMWGGDERQVSLPSTRHIRVDESWVWNDWQSRMLEICGINSRMHVVGPILWYLPESAPTNRGKEFRITVFDVTPVTAAVAHKLGLTDNYYTAENMIQFVEDIVHACDAVERSVGRSTKVLLKHKRGHTSIHDQHYISSVERLVAADRRVELVPPQTDMYSLISGCDVSVAIPYSSPAYVAEHLGRPAIYYDPTGKVWPNYGAGGMVTFVARRERLAENLISMAKESDKNAPNVVAGGARLEDQR